MGACGTHGRGVVHARDARAEFLAQTGGITPVSYRPSPTWASEDGQAHAARGAPRVSRLGEDRVQTLHAALPWERNCACSRRLERPFTPRFRVRPSRRCRGPTLNALRRSGNDSQAGSRRSLCAPIAHPIATGGPVPGNSSRRPPEGVERPRKKGSHAITTTPNARTSTMHRYQRKETPMTAAAAAALASATIPLAQLPRKSLQSPHAVSRRRHWRNLQASIACARRGSQPILVRPIDANLYEICRRASPHPRGRGQRSSQRSPPPSAK